MNCIYCNNILIEPSKEDSYWTCTNHGDISVRFSFSNKLNKYSTGLANIFYKNHVSLQFYRNDIERIMALYAFDSKYKQFRIYNLNPSKTLHDGSFIPGIDPIINFDHVENITPENVKQKVSTYILFI